MNQLIDTYNNNKVIFLVATSLTAITATGTILTYLVSKKEPQPVRLELDPRGSKNILKQMIASGMTFVAQKKEVSKSTKASPKQLESFHKPENHEFFNESYYFNGCDLKTRDRFITRISRRSFLGRKSYVFLLIDSKEHGVLALEEEVPAEDGENPSASGVKFVCEIPMRKWHINFSGLMRKNCTHPKDLHQLNSSERVQVELDLYYETESPLFWYMRDDHPSCLANNLSQETWGMDFLRVCLKRTVDHAHYEDFGRARGTVKVGGNNPSQYDFGTFRDHSWDIRRWATMDNLNILLITLEKPLILSGCEYWYIDLTLVNMPGNVGGVARYSTGYAFGNKLTTPKLVLISATSILDIEYDEGKPGFVGGPIEREPKSTQVVIINLCLHPRDVVHGINPTQTIKITMGGKTRRLLYWPDQGEHKVYEDSLDFSIENVNTRENVIGYGTRQSGFRCGEFDPSLGGCG